VIARLFKNNKKDSLVKLQNLLSLYVSHQAEYKYDKSGNAINVSFHFFGVSKEESQAIKAVFDSVSNAYKVKNYSLTQKYVDGKPVEPNDFGCCVNFMFNTVQSGSAKNYKQLADELNKIRKLHVDKMRESLLEVGVANDAIGIISQYAFANKNK
jgi:hypothetical protein